mmetsp:Transcript_44607/g.108881  ORF Transcript_44607/g.108881 Transcript_44607/m.108881 type:complete len:215 (-) Transcript_44607:43-687(-)
MQVFSGAAAGAATAYAVMKMSAFLRKWGSRGLPESKRLGYALAGVVGISLFIAVEHWVLEEAGMHPSESVLRAKAACRGGMHQTVGTAKGIARDTGALLGAALGRMLYYRFSPSMKAEKPVGDDQGWRNWQLFVVWAIAAEVCMALFTTMENGTVGMTTGGLERDVAEAVCSGLKYCTFGALSTGVFALLFGTTRHALMAERKNSDATAGKEIS